MTRVNDSFCELKLVILTTKSVGIGQLTRLTESPIPDSEAALFENRDLASIIQIQIRGLIEKCVSVSNKRNGDDTTSVSKNFEDKVIASLVSNLKASIRVS